MKTFIILLLISFNSFAQFKIEVKDLDGNLTHSGDFTSPEEAKAWASTHAIQGNFGRPEKLVPLDGATDEDRALAIEVVPASGDAPSMLRTRAKFTVSDPIDVSAQKLAEAQAIQDKKDAQERLKSLCSGVDAASTTAAKVTALKSCLVDLIKASK
jgi:hypothetical protein